MTGYYQFPEGLTHSYLQKANNKLMILENLTPKTNYVTVV